MRTKGRGPWRCVPAVVPGAGGIIYRRMQVGSRFISFLISISLATSSPPTLTFLRSTHLAVVDQHCYSLPLILLRSNWQTRLGEYLPGWQAQEATKSSGGPSAGGSLELRPVNARLISPLVSCRDRLRAREPGLTRVGSFSFSRHSEPGSGALKRKT